MPRFALLLVPAVFSLIAGPAWADLVNGGFESGDFTGWNLTMPSAGEANVVPSAEALINGDGPTVTLTPTEGVKFAHLRAGGVGTETVIEQSFSALAGDELTLDMFFDARDFARGDESGWARLYDGGGSLIDTLYNMQAIDLPPFGLDGWTSGSHTFAASGSYTLKIGITNNSSTSIGSYIGVDNINLPIFVVPAPGAALLGLLGIGVVDALRRRVGS